MSDADLEQKLKDARTELFNLRFQLATGQLDNPARIKEAKKDIARVLTEMRSREVGVAQDAAS
jgi:large subunit ribosomal protein L29